MPQYYPIFLDVEGKPVLVVGGGNIALRKVQTLLEYGALVTVVSPKLISELAALVDNRHCLWLNKEYDSTDLQDAQLIFSCTDQEEVNAQVSNDAQEALRLINVVDDPVKCSFIVPSIFRQGDLSIAVSTGGSSPIVARQIRAELEDHYGNEMAYYLNILKDWRPKIKSTLPPERRVEFWEAVTDGTVLQLIRDKQYDEAKGRVEQCFQSLLA